MSLKKLSSKTLPYWKDWKKKQSEIFLSEAEEIAEEGGEVVVDETVAELIVETLEAEEVVAGGSSTKCF